MSARRMEQRGRPYYDQMIEYYDGAKYSFDWGAVRQSYVDDYADLKPEQEPSVEYLQQTLSGRRVLEVAAGGGRWTRHIAAVAESVVATDTSDQILKIGRRLVPDANVQFLKYDAWNLDALRGTFDAAFHYNFINHVPFSDWPALLQHIHTKLEPGAVVLMGGQDFRGPVRDDLDWYSEYDCTDGKHYELVDNVPEEKQLISLIGLLAQNIEFDQHAGWWVKYSVL